LKINFDKASFSDKIQIIYNSYSFLGGKMLTSILLSTYKDLTALKLIIEALEQQTNKNFEVIVVEDDDSIEVKEYLNSINPFFKIIHYSHKKESGNKRSVALNNSIKLANGEYVIYLDGDCIPFTTFVDGHLKLANKNNFLCGRRVDLGDKVSNNLRQRKISVFDLEKKWLLKLFYILNDNVENFDKIFYFKPNSIIQKIISFFDKNLHILASNFSCFKDDIIKINGHDESLLPGPAVDDTDVEWRLKKIGLSPKSVKFCANVFHLNHPREERKEIFEKNLQKILHKQGKDEYIAKQGIEKY
jgi:glycosyltransferase involved in cell wall biosynthesis